MVIELGLQLVRKGGHVILDHCIGHEMRLDLLQLALSPLHPINHKLSRHLRSQAASDFRAEFLLGQSEAGRRHVIRAREFPNTCKHLGLLHLVLLVEVGRQVFHISLVHCELGEDVSNCLRAPDARGHVLGLNLVGFATRRALLQVACIVVVLIFLQLFCCFS